MFFPFTFGEATIIGSVNRNSTFCPVSPVPLYFSCYVLFKEKWADVGQKMIRIKSWICICYLSFLLTMKIKNTSKAQVPAFWLKVTIKNYWDVSLAEKVKYFMVSYVGNLKVKLKEVESRLVAIRGWKKGRQGIGRCWSKGTKFS